MRSAAWPTPTTTGVCGSRVIRHYLPGGHLGPEPGVRPLKIGCAGAGASVDKMLETGVVKTRIAIRSLVTRINLTRWSVVVCNRSAGVCGGGGFGLGEHRFVDQLSQHGGLG